jgi:hypothetical protein
MIMPGPGGAHNWAPMSFNPNTGLMYIPSNASSSSTYAVSPNFVYNPATSNTGVARGGNRGGNNAPPNPNAIQDPGAAIGGGQAPPPPPALPAAPALPVIGPQVTGAYLVAWDVLKQKEVWRVQGGGSIGGGTLTTASDLVFQSLGNGRLRALTADKGEQLMETATGQTGGMGPPITYMVDGKQYVAVAGGQGIGGGGRGANANPPANPILPRVYVYVLDGNAPNPTAPPPQQ